MPQSEAVEINSLSAFTSGSFCCVRWLASCFSPSRMSEKFSFYFAFSIMRLLGAIIMYYDGAYCWGLSDVWRQRKKRNELCRGLETWTRMNLKAVSKAVTFGWAPALYTTVINSTWRSSFDFAFSSSCCRSFRFQSGYSSAVHRGSEEKSFLPFRCIQFPDRKLLRNESRKNWQCLPSSFLSRSRFYMCRH